MADTLIVESPAKVNLRLEILGKREDGYHEIRTLFQKISLHDTLHFSLVRKGGVYVSTDNPSLPVGEKNLAYRAGAMFLDRSNYRGGILIEIQKRIPLGAGLGGGSSNAATTLKTLNLLLKTGLSRKELMKIGLQIGADVPFFLTKGAAIGTGIGENLEKIEVPHLWFLLIYPNFEVSTRWAYQNFILTKRRFHYNIHKLLETPSKISRILKNDLEEVVRAAYPQISTMKEVLSSAGAEGALMTGSGPTVFGVFRSEKGSLEVFEKLKNQVEEMGWVLLRARSISG